VNHRGVTIPGIWYYAVVLIAVPPGSAIDSMDGLKGKTVGIIAGPVNQKLIAAIVKAYDLDRAKVVFKDISPNDTCRRCNPSRFRPCW
jgi:ABC-type nitrate/sulfonate/bicarbonate transport system substrate-binding protein